MTHRRLGFNCLLLTGLLLQFTPVFADGPLDNIPAKVRPVPPLPTTPVSDADRKELESGIKKLQDEITALQTQYKSKPEWQYIADVMIYLNAVRYPLVYNEQIDIKSARKALLDGLQRASALKQGNAPWKETGGPRGYVSKIDGSVQPYLLTVPQDLRSTDKQKKFRIDFVSHGRNEGLTELKFISGGKDHAVSAGSKFVVQLYGRYCCANKFAGEIDLFECLASLQSQYPIDENRILNIGFSMGGASCWQFATHYPDRWAAASPGAGFAETKEFLNNFQNETIKPTWYEEKLWHWYDCTDYALNISMCPTIAYAGEIDKQKQASDIMERYMNKEGLKLDRIIGPKTGHAYEKNAKIELDKRLDELLAKGRDPMPKEIHFTTWTLRYNQCFWITLDGLEKHWDRARIDAKVDGDDITISTCNITRFTMTVPVKETGAEVYQGKVIIDGKTLEYRVAHYYKSPIGKVITFQKTADGWNKVEIPEPDSGKLKKRHNLQGPIDDAFMDSFLIVLPTGKAANEKVAVWSEAESKHAIDHWRKQFRGEARIKKDVDVVPDDMISHNLILFGDASSNKIISRVMDRLPIGWDSKTVTVGDKEFASNHHALIAIHPNPLNDRRYVVLNSGFTFREYDYLNNARQIAKLPDYAVVDLDVPVSSRSPGGIVEAGFFDENWQLQKEGGRK